MIERAAHTSTPHLPVGVLGGRSLVGRFLIPRLVSGGHPVAACSRWAAPRSLAGGNPHWCKPGGPLPPGLDTVQTWIAVCPIWATQDWLDWLESVGLERLVALSSTSLTTKADSTDPDERQLAQRIATAEAAVLDSAARRGFTATVLRPTMIYDGHTDTNVAAIAACIRRFGRLPLCGPGTGLRQPVHADDVAQACARAAFHPEPETIYPLSGGEQLSFRELVERTCRAHGLPPRTMPLPPWLWRLCVAAARRAGIASGLSSAAGPRMNEDLVFDHAAAQADLGFSPRPFTIDACPVPDIFPQHPGKGRIE